MTTPDRLGVAAVEGGVAAAVFSASAERVFLCLFDERGERELARHPLTRGDGDIHAAFIPRIAPGARYGLRADGSYEPDRGHWFDPAKLLVDPYAQALDRPFAWRPELAAPRSGTIDTASMVPKAIVPSPDAPPVGRDRPRPPGFIYEIAVRAFSKTHPAVPEALRGAVGALAHPAVIEHLTRLGVDTVELMPLAAWIDERHLPPLGLANAWGYNPVAFMAPDPRLAPGGLAQIRAAVSALHQAGIGVILDAVFNHTGESDALGPTLSLRGLDNFTYYRHADDEPGRLINDTGCGNTLAADRPAVVRLILDAMRHWVRETGIDGFRFDLAATLGREPHGYNRDAPLFTAIAADPLLGPLTIVAEPWDVGPGGYRLGDFPFGWHEWNDRFRDDVRRFWRGDGGIGSLATRLAGSSDIFGHGGRSPSASVNFLAAHDGMTLNDVVSYADKHNEANGEENRDGAPDNASWNHGEEGPAADFAVEEARQDDLRALLSLLFVARGTPMLTAGDEFRRTQRGNNNAYAQDNAITWLDWQAADMSLAGFAAALAKLRRAHPALSADRFLTGGPLDPTGIPDVAWLHPAGRTMIDADWTSGSRVLGLVLYASGDRVAVWINGGKETADAWLPEVRDGLRWNLLSDSSLFDFAVDQPGMTLLPPRSVRIFAEAGGADSP